MARMSGLPQTAARERTADTLRHVGLYEERYRPMGGYSTGMKQRVKLAQALVHDPGLVLLDEPTNGLDPAGRDDMLELIRRIGTEFGISVIVTSHLLGELERVCDGIVVIDGGRLLRHSTTASVTAADAGGQRRGRRRPGRAAWPGSDDAASACSCDGGLLHVDVDDATGVRRGARRGRRARPRAGADGAAAAPDDRDLHRQPRSAGETACLSRRPVSRPADRRDPRHRLPPLRRPAARRGVHPALALPRHPARRLRPRPLRPVEGDAVPAAGA